MGDAAKKSGGLGAGLSPSAGRGASGLGKGLGALLSVVPREDGGAEELRNIPVSAITANPRQPRRKFDQNALDALSGSITERGVLQPVLVRPLGDGWELIGLRQPRDSLKYQPSFVPTMTQSRSRWHSSRTWPGRTSTRSRRPRHALPWWTSLASARRRLAEGSGAVERRCPT